MVYLDSHPTMPPPPDNPLITIQLFYPHNLPLAKQVGYYLKSHVRSESFMVHTVELEQLSQSICNVHANIIVIGIDEFCNVNEIFKEIEKYFCKAPPIIVHYTAPIDMNTSIVQYHPLLGSFIKHDFYKLISLVENVLLSMV